MQKDIIKILGVKVNTLNYKESLDFIVKNIIEKKQILVSTPNPEILLTANKNPEYKELLNSFNLNTADGIGLIYASKYLKFRKLTDKVIKERVCGSDLTKSICADKRLKEKKVFLLGASEEVSKATAKILQDNNPHIIISGRYSGRADEKDDKKSVDLINSSQADIVFIAFGAPKQELWIKRNKKNLKNVSLLIGIGGSFDFISGKIKRAPKLMQKLGIEWLYRLIKEPKRIKRILNAVLVFPITFLISKKEQ